MWGQSEDAEGVFKKFFPHEDEDLQKKQVPQQKKAQEEDGDDLDLYG